MVEGEEQVPVCGVQYSSTAELCEKLLMNEEIIWAIGCLEAQDKWIGWVMALLDLDENATLPLIVPKTTGQCPLLRYKAQPHTGHKTFPGSFALVISAAAAVRYVLSGPHKFVFKLEVVKRTMANKLVLDQIAILPKLGIYRLYILTEIRWWMALRKILVQPHLLPSQGRGATGHHQLFVWECTVSFHGKWGMDLKEDREKAEAPH